MKKKRRPVGQEKTKTKLEQLNQSHGMDERVQKAKELEELINEFNPYGTSISEFEQKLNEMV